ncbi:methyl-accepting chemotaxis protein [Thiomicrospira microaerophila]|uniref:methyl-accepting chemotaxis protein n=1 Tax=Thiomicrospira microaerophila TaxID=406020 RepID=UPI0005CA0315|nr:methyl-accepting chemotaxis protein [Thiomicrospira microaerophila]
MSQNKSLELVLTSTGFSAKEGDAFEPLLFDYLHRIQFESLKKQLTQNKQPAFIDLQLNGQFVSVNLVPTETNIIKASFKSITETSRIETIQANYQKLNSGYYRCREGKIVHKAKDLLLSLTGKNHLSIKQQVVAYSVVFLIVVTFSLYLQKEMSQQTVIKGATADYAQQAKRQFNATIQARHMVGSTVLTGISKDLGVPLAIFERDVDTLDIYFGDIREHFAKTTDFKQLRVDITDEKGISFYSSWLENQSDLDRSGIAYISSQIRSPKVKTVLDIGRQGAAIRTLLPIITPAGQYIGSIELFQPTSTIAESFKNDGLSYIELYHEDYLKKLGGFTSELLAEPRFDAQKKLVLAQWPGFTPNQAIISRLKDRDVLSILQRSTLVENGYIHTVLPMHNEAKDIIGYVIVSEGLDSFNQKIAEQLDAIDTTFYTTVTVLALTMLSVLLFIWLAILSRINRLRQQIEHSVETSDLSLRVDQSGRDELSNMAKAYNQQASLTQFAISETSTALDKIVNGDLSHEISYPFKSDFADLKQKLNNTATGLSTTFCKIEEVMTDLKMGRFDAEHSNTLNGAYFKVVEDCKSSMHTLSSVFAEVTRVLYFAQRGKFDERMQLSGAQNDVDKLVQTINAALSNLESGFDDIVQAAQALAGGDFAYNITKPYEYKIDEAKAALNQSFSDLSAVMTEIINEANDIEQNIQTVSTEADALSTRTQQQAASIEETSAAMEQTSSQVQANLQSTREALVITKSSVDVLKGANAAMGETQSAMTGIKTASAKIQEIVAIIDSIAFQTNLLALNAAVEAARAGDHGRGFAVVAGEVRSLAGKSADAAKQIGNLINDSVQRVDAGVTKVETVNSYIEKITQEIQSVSSVVETINLSSEQQSQGVREVNNAINNIDKITQQNSHVVEQTNQAVISVREKVTALLSKVSKFKIKQTGLLKRR